MTYKPKMPKGEAADIVLSSDVYIKWKYHNRARDIAIIQFLYVTGCRNAEAASIKIRDIDMDKKIAHVTGKGNKTRAVFCK